jgi:phosphatidylglycerophosphate synthase
MGESGAGRPGLTVAGWSQLHYGIDPARVPLLTGWLRLVWAVARPLRHVPPIVLTVLGAAFAITAVLVAPWAALVLVLAAVLCDALDGAVALMAARASAAGAVADKVADRIADTAFALVIWRCGAPLWLALVAGGLSLAHEAIRESIRGRALSRITIAERPTRVICTVLACATAGLGPWAPTVCGAVWIVLAIIGLVQVTRR